MRYNRTPSKYVATDASRKSWFSKVLKYCIVRTTLFNKTYPDYRIASHQDVWGHPFVWALLQHCALASDIIDFITCGLTKPVYGELKKGRRRGARSFWMVESRARLSQDYFQHFDTSFVNQQLSSSARAKYLDEMCNISISWLIISRLNCQILDPKRANTIQRASSFLDAELATIGHRVLIETGKLYQTKNGFNYYNSDSA